jgi:hypothetical protein
MPGTSDQWAALDRHNERLVDAGGPHRPAGRPTAPHDDPCPPPQADQDGTTGQDGSDPLRGQDAGLAAGPDASQQAGRQHGLRARGFAAASAC